MSQWNPAPLLRWNMDKRYLMELEQQGATIVPAEWLARGANANLGALMELGLIEPFLFLGQAPQSAERFMDALRGVHGRSSSSAPGIEREEEGNATG